MEKLFLGSNLVEESTEAAFKLVTRYRTLGLIGFRVIIVLGVQIVSAAPFNSTGKVKKYGVDNLPKTYLIIFFFLVMVLHSGAKCKRRIPA